MHLVCSRLRAKQLKGAFPFTACNNATRSPFAEEKAEAQRCSVTYLSAVLQLVSRGPRILTRPLPPRPVTFRRSLSHLPHTSVVGLQGERFGIRGHLCLIVMPSILGRSCDSLAQAPWERIFMWRKRKGVEADVGSTVLGRWRFPETALRQPTSTSLLVFSDVAGLRRPGVTG